MNKLLRSKHQRTVLGNPSLPILPSLFLSALLLGIISTGCSHAPTLPTNPQSAEYQVFKLTGAPALEASALEPSARQSIELGGFSGLIYEGLNSGNGALAFVTVTDRGPNTDPIEIQGKEKRPFLSPNSTPEIVHLEADPKDLQLKVLSRFPIQNPKGKAINGLPNTAKDEDPIDTLGRPLPKSLEGLDIESITRDAQGNYWLCEEYRPSILKVSKQGRILKRYVPKNSLSDGELAALKKLWGNETVSDSLPELFGQRRSNRGFEGITFHNGLIYAALQSPLKKGEELIPWLEFDPQSEKSSILYYPLTDKKVDKIGDLASRGSEILVIEQNSKTGDEGIKMIYSVTGFEKRDHKIQEKILNKKLLVDLGKLPGYGQSFDHEKLEGLAAISPERLAVIHDNDFGLTGNLTISSGLAEKKNDPSSNLLLLRLAPKGQSF